MKKELKNKTKETNNKEKSSKNSIINKRNIIIAVSIICFIIVIVLVVIFSNKSTGGKSGDKVEDVLIYNDYKTYFSYGSNKYDKNGSTCYDLDYEKEDCEREINFWNFISVDIVNKNDKNHIISAFIDLDDNYNISDITLRLESGKSDDDEYSIYNTFEIVHDKNDEEKYSRYYDGSEQCTNLEKTKELNADNLTKCGKTGIDKINTFAKEFEKILKDMNLNENDLFNYLEYYYNNYAKKLYLDAKDKYENNKLSYDEIKNHIEKSYFKIEKQDSGVILNGLSGYYKIYLLKRDGKFSGFAYESQYYKDLLLLYYDSTKTYMGTNKSETCSYYIDALLDSMKDKTADGTYCSEDMIHDLKFLKTSFETNLRSMNITEDELFTFAKTYLDKEVN